MQKILLFFIFFITKTIANENIFNECCKFIDNPNELFICTNKITNLHFQNYQKILNNNNIKHSKIAFVSYSTSYIIDYAPYAYAINSIYIYNNNYTLKWETEETGANYDINDQRWNKVMILSEALNTWAKKIDYIVWIDADLIVLNMNLNINNIIEQYLWADMIISRDPVLENGIINSGMMIIKNSNYSKTFLDKWWKSFDHSKGMDQLVFDKLYKSNVFESSKHFALLEPDEINSNFPAWINQKSYNPILHLAGGSSPMRILTFKSGFNNLCNSYNSCLSSNNDQFDSLNNISNNYLVIKNFESQTKSSNQICQVPNQIGLNQKFLKKIFENSLYINELYIGNLKETIKIELETYDNPSLELIVRIKNKLKDIRQSGNNNNEINIYSNEFNKCLVWVRDELLKLWNNKINDELLYYNDYDIKLLQEILESTFDLVIIDIFNDNEKLIVMKEIDGFIDTLIKSVNISQKGITLYYKFKQREFISNISFRQNNLQHEINALQDAYLIWLELLKLNFYGSGNGIVDRFKEGSDVLIKLGYKLVIYSTGDTSIFKGLLYLKLSLNLIYADWSENINSSESGDIDLNNLEYLNYYPYILDKLAPYSAIISLIEKWIAASDCIIKFYQSYNIELIQNDVNIYDFVLNFYVHINKAMYEIKMLNQRNEDINYNKIIDINIPEIFHQRLKSLEDSVNNLKINLLIKKISIQKSINDSKSVKLPIKKWRRKKNKLM